MMEAKANRWKHLAFELVQEAVMLVGAIVVGYEVLIMFI